jgi:hypothetical protein
MGERRKPIKIRSVIGIALAVVAIISTPITVWGFFAQPPPSSMAWLLAPFAAILSVPFAVEGFRRRCRRSECRAWYAREWVSNETQNLDGSIHEEWATERTATVTRTVRPLDSRESDPPPGIAVEEHVFQPVKYEVTKNLYETTDRYICRYCHHTWTDIRLRVEQRLPKRIGPA